MIASHPTVTKRLAAASLLATLAVACNAADTVDEFGTTPLMRAARRGDTASVYRLLADGADVNAVVPRRDVKEFIADVANLGDLPRWDVGFTPLLYAVKTGQSRVARILIDSGANVSATARHGETALGFALGRNDVALVRQLTQAGATVNPGQFAKVVLEGTAELVRVLAQRGADVNGIAPPDQMRGRPWPIPLVIAATLRGDTAVLKALMEAGAKVNARDQNGWTALRWARDPEVQRQNARSKEVIAALLASGARDSAGAKAEGLFDAIHAKDAARVRAALRDGANPNARDKRGVTPVIEAARLGAPEIIRLLADAGANVNLNADFGPNALTAAIESESAETVRVLLSAGAKANLRDGRGWAPLFLASRQRRSDIAALLLADSAKVDRFAIRDAALFGDTAIVRMFIGHGAGVSFAAGLNGAVQGCKNGDNAAIFAMLLQGGADPKQAVYIMPRAAARCRADVLQLLLRHGGDANQRDFGNVTPLMSAAGSGDLESVRVLLAAGADPRLRDQEDRTAMDHAWRHPTVQQELGRILEGGQRRNQ